MSQPLMKIAPVLVVLVGSLGLAGCATKGFVREQVATGTQLQLTMAQSELFPNMVVQMIAIGEESGSLDSMSARVADFYEAEVDNAVDALSSLLEPLIMIFIGGIVGAMVVGMYLPIFKLAAAI